MLSILLNMAGSSSPIAAGTEGYSEDQKTKGGGQCLNTETC
jgi:TctA family transporter